MATAGATRTYPTTVIPSDPTDANFEADFRTSTELLQTAVKDVDDEVSVARGASSTLSARLTAISAPSVGFSGGGGTNAAGTALTITGTVTNIAHATMDSNLNWLVSFDKLSSTATATLNGTAVAMAIALG